MNQEVQKKSEMALETARDDNLRVVVPAMSVREDDDGYRLDVMLPGVTDEALTLTVEDRTVVVDAVNRVTPPEDFTLIREECPPVRYRGMFEVPDRVDTQGLTATLKNGLLHIQLPKREEVKPRKIAVKTA